MSRLDEEQGSYRYDSFHDKEAELVRLERQSQKFLGLELSRLRQFLDVQQDWNIIDVGCGPGYFTVPLAREVPKGRVVGVDPSEELLAVARDHARGEGVGHVSFEVGSVYDLRRHHEQFDLVYARFLLQHMTRPAEAIGELVRLAKPGGTVAIVDIDFGWLSIHPDDARFEQLLSLSGRHHADPFVGHKLAGMLKEAGLTGVCQHVELFDDVRVGGIQDFLVLILPFLAHLTAEEDMSASDKERAINGLIDDMNRNPASTGALGVFAAWGRRARE